MEGPARRKAALTSTALLLLSLALAEGNRLAFEIDDEEGEDIKSTPFSTELDLEGSMCSE